MEKMIKKLFQMPRNIVIFLISAYQRLLSPDHSFWAKRIYPHGYCRFYPTCSEYSKQVIKKRGLAVGLFKSGWRILRCNPWNKGGIDLPK